MPKEVIVKPFPVQEDTITRYEGMRWWGDGYGAEALFVSYDKKTNAIVPHHPDVLAWLKSNGY